MFYHENIKYQRYKFFNIRRLLKIIVCVFNDKTDVNWLNFEIHTYILHNYY